MHQKKHLRWLPQAWARGSAACFFLFLGLGWASASHAQLVVAVPTNPDPTPYTQPLQPATPSSDAAKNPPPTAPPTAPELGPQAGPAITPPGVSPSVTLRVPLTVSPTAAVGRTAQVDDAESPRHRPTAKGQRRNVGSTLMLVGGLAFAVSYLAVMSASIVSFEAPNAVPTWFRPFAIPVVGPLMGVAEYSKTDDAQGLFGSISVGMVGVLFAVDSIIQIAGLSCLISGAVVYAKGSDGSGSRLAVLPSGNGLALLGTF